MTERTEKLAEGKTKIIWDDPDASRIGTFVLIESKDDITAGNGAKHDVLENKAVLATTTTCNVFELLNHKGINTHYLGQVDERTFRAYMVQMIPLELVVRRLATGSYLKRHPEAIEGEVFSDLVFEIFHKDDAAHDPLLGFDYANEMAVRYPAGEPLNPQMAEVISLEGFGLGSNPRVTVEYLEMLTRRVSRVLEEAWAAQGVQLVDLKIECGWAADQLVVADVIDNDSWRIWPAGQKSRQLDKQVYRELAGADDPVAKAKQLGAIRANYAKVAEMTGNFLN